MPKCRRKGRTVMGGFTDRAKDSLPERRSIRSWPAADRPRERLIRNGPEGLSDVELLAIVLRSGSGSASAVDLAGKILQQAGSLQALARRNVFELQRVSGIGSAKAAEIHAAFELGRRLQAAEGGVRPVIRTPDDAAGVLIPKLRDLAVESFVVMVLDAANGVIDSTELSRGTLNASLVHPREVYKFAIDRRGAAVIVGHNHPSGNPEPSREDIEITRQLVDAGKVVGIPLHDHLIVAGNRRTSFAERGLL
jgi:DNA repair protein RadC